MIPEARTAGYGDAVVLDDVSRALEEGGSLALLGRNGMGKTTLLMTLMGLTRLRAAASRIARRVKSCSATPRNCTGPSPCRDGDYCVARSSVRNVSAMSWLKRASARLCAAASAS